MIIFVHGLKQRIAISDIDVRCANRVRGSSSGRGEEFRAVIAKDGHASPNITTCSLMCRGGGFELLQFTFNGPFGKREIQDKDDVDTWY